MKERFGKQIDPQKTKISQISNVKENIKNLKKEFESILKLPQTYFKQCPICENTAGKIEHTSNGFPWVRCPECTHLYKQHMPSFDLMRKRIEETTTEVYLKEDSLKYRLENIEQPKIDFMLEHLPKSFKGKWLDLATGLAGIPYILKKNGWDVTCTELHNPFLEHAKKKFKIQPLKKTLPEIFDKFRNQEKFDVIGTFGYFDYIPNPIDHFKMINKLLKIDGLIGVNLPQSDSLTGALANLWPNSSVRHGLTINYHVFSKKSLFKALEKTGFEVQTVWWFGLDIHELVVRLIELDENFKDSEAFRLIYKNFNELQKVIDHARKSDLILLCAKKIKNLD